MTFQAEPRMRLLTVRIVDPGHRHLLAIVKAAMVFISFSSTLLFSF
jgi:hypothetical protein